MPYDQSVDLKCPLYIALHQMDMDVKLRALEAYRSQITCRSLNHPLSLQSIEAWNRSLGIFGLDVDSKQTAYAEVFNIIRAAL